MALLKKTNDLWQPSEKPNIRVGETLEVTDYAGLVKTGMAVLVDESGNELELPGQLFTCPICFEVMDGVMKLTQHLSTHLKKNKQVLEEKAVSQAVAEKIATEIVEPVIKVVEPVAKEPSVEAKEAIKASEPKKLTRAEILAKARAAKKANKQ